jgi:hypothetical protein
MDDRDQLEGRASYLAYDLRICSELALPELDVAALTPNVSVSIGEVAPAPSPLDATGGAFWAVPGEACHYLEQAGSFLVREGRQIVVDPAEGADPALLRLSILGPALGILLHQRGHLVLHASTVAVDGGAAAFVGGRRWGKSTLAAAMYLRGHRVVADDVTALTVGHGPPSVLPGFPQLKLWPDAAASLGQTVDTLPRLHPRFEKRALRVTRGFSRQPVPLRRVYVLDEGPAADGEPLEPTEALVEMLRHWYGSRFGDGLLRFGDAAAIHLQLCAALVRDVAVRRLRRPARAASVADVVDLVEADLAR